MRKTAVTAISGLVLATGPVLAQEAPVLEPALQRLARVLAKVELDADREAVAAELGDYFGRVFALPDKTR